MCYVDIYPEAVDKHLRKAHRLVTEPVSMLHLVRVAIECEVVLEGLQDGELGEDAETSAK